ncbi:MAG TPA: DUF2157 domain-containing protein [Chryseolinea sp.]|nr:DUF2157 domain-containing protein [Chryseolinea sp.]
MSKQILKELSDLVNAQVITEETAERIKSHYTGQVSHSTNRLFIVFGILGALLVGMGLVLIIAHNWDVLPKVVKLAIGLLPLLIGQVTAGILVLKKSENRTYREGTGAFLFAAVAISISIVSQVYNIEGNLGNFLLVWTALTLPIVYVLRSSMASLLYISGITWYGCEVSYFNYPHGHAWWFWLLFILILPFYYFEFLKDGVKNNFFYFHSWLLALSLTICLGVFVDAHGELIMIAYMCLFSAFVILSELPTFDTGRVISNAYLVIGSLGVIISLLILSFDFYWDELGDSSSEHFTDGLEFIVGIVTTVIAGALLVIGLRRKSLLEINSKSFAFIVFIFLFFIGITAPTIAQLLTNVVILVLAVNTIRNGAQRDHLGILNYGLLIITALILCRFFDTDFSFVVRGILFIAVGVGFFAANYYMVKKRKREV